MKRIVYLHQYFRAPHMSGGTRSYEFARRLAAHGYDVHVITSDGRGESPLGWRTEAIEGFSVHWLGIAYSNKMSFSRRIVAFVLFAVRSCWRARSLHGDIIFATSTPLTIIIPALVAAAFRKTPIVFEVRDLWPEIPIAMGVLRNPMAIWGARWMERIAYRRSSHIIALSPGMKAGVVSSGIDPDHVSVIPNGADLAMFDPKTTQSKDWSESCPLAVGKKLVVYCGTLGLVNDVGYLVDVAESMQSISQEVVFLIVGDGLDKQAIQIRAEQVGVLNQSVFLLPSVPKAEVPQILASAAFCVSTVMKLKELENNSANKFFDALAAGKPIAINHNGWQLDLLIGSGAGIGLPVDDPTSAAEILWNVLKDSSRLESMGRAARQLAEDHFDRDCLTGELIEIIQKVGNDY